MTKHVLFVVVVLIIPGLGSLEAAITLNLTGSTTNSGSNAPVAPFASTKLQYFSEYGVAGDYATGDGDLFRFSRLNVGTAGTGAIDPFLRIQNSPSEQGFNHDRTTSVFNEDHAHTDSLTIASVPTYSIDGNDWMEFLLDVNEPSSAAERLLSLNQLQIFAATSAVATSPTLINSGSGTTAGIPYIEFNNAVEVFRLSNAAIQYQILIDSSIGASGGSGKFDLRFFFDLDVIASLGPQYTHFIVYSQFGAPGSAASNSGFEEWSIGPPHQANIPEPGTVPMLLLVASLVVYRRVVKR